MPINNKCCHSPQARLNRTSFGSSGPRAPQLPALSPLIAHTLIHSFNSRLSLRNNLLGHLTPKAILAAMIPPQLGHLAAVINQLPLFVDGGGQTVAGFELASCVATALGARQLEREIDHRPQAHCGRQRLALFQQLRQ